MHIDALKSKMWAYWDKVELKFAATRNRRSNTVLPVWLWSDKYNT